MFENVDGRTDGRTMDGRTTDAGVTGILIAHLGAFGSGELKKHNCCQKYLKCFFRYRKNLQNGAEWPSTMDLYFACSIIYA